MIKNRTKYPKVSVIVPCYHTEKYISRCLDSIINQTYKELEIICVNDCSGDMMERILRGYAQRDSRIKIVSNKKNIGLFHSRIKGSKSATGEFICFVDSDDYIEPDFYRRLVFEQINTDADVVFSNICNESPKTKTVFTGPSSQMMMAVDTDFFSSFINSEGYYYRWHVVWNKIIRKAVWDEAIERLVAINRRIMMCEDFVFSTVTLALAKKVSIVDDVFYFYYASDESSTNIKNKTLKDIKKSIDDIFYAFEISDNILKDIFGEKFDIIKCRDRYITSWLDVSKKISPKAYSETLSYIKTKDPNFKIIDLSKLCIAGCHAPYDGRGNDLIEGIRKADVVSFDVFDTLIFRPFYEPCDLFTFLDDYFVEITGSNGALKFSEVRKEAELLCRKAKNSEVNLDEIYSTIHDYFDIPNETLEDLKKKEIALELRFCSERKYAKRLFELAIYLEKRIIITSDMYLSRSVIDDILKKNGFSGYQEIFVSCEYRKTKADGKLYDVIKSKYNDIFHIDDSLLNCNIAKKRGLSCGFLPKAVDCYQGSYDDVTRSSFKGRISFGRYFATSGVRLSLGIIANKIFDNPFMPRLGVFNNSPYEIGYSALGMHLLALASWLIAESRNKGIKNLCFLSRDGYMPLKAVKAVRKYYDFDDEEINLKYIYTSRRATLPMAISDDYDFYALYTYMSWPDSTPKTVIQQLSGVINTEKVDSFLKNHYIDKDKKFNSSGQFLSLLSLIKKELYDKAKHEELLELLNDYYGECIHEGDGIFDIGYSAKPELLLSNFLQRHFTIFFTHSISSESFDNARMANNDIEYFYDYSPSFTGALRELFYSSTKGSCVGYTKLDNKEITPVFSSNKDLDFYNKSTIKALQDGALTFIDDFIEIFGSDIEKIDLNGLYMSLPMEYYLQCSSELDRQCFNSFIFDDNGYMDVRIPDYWRQQERNYDNIFSKSFSVDFLPKSKRLLFYLLFDHKALKKKINEKIDDMSESPKLHRRAVYILLKDRKRIYNKVRKGEK